jgi:hypothetical protein
MRPLSGSFADVRLWPFSSVFYFGSDRSKADMAGPLMVPPGRE